MNSIEQTLSERGERYGSFENNAAVTQELQGTLRATQGWKRMTHAQREACEMICHKLSRIVNGDPYYEDSWQDISGYAVLARQEAEVYHAMQHS